MARRRFFNRNQPRDSRGRWTSGGGKRPSLASRGSAKRRKATQRSKSAALTRQRRVMDGIALGAGTGFFVAGGYGAAVGAVIGGTKAVRKNRKSRR